MDEGQIEQKRKTLKKNLDWQKGRKKYMLIYELQAGMRKRELQEIYINLDRQEIERDCGRQKKDKNRYRWIDEELAEIEKMELREIGINLD